MTEQEYFKKGEKRVITWGIKNKLSIVIQWLLWENIREARRNGITLDYLQVFKLRTVRTRSKDKMMLRITHIQEEPVYENKISFPIEPDEAINGTIWVIDDLTHATMMWAEEY